MNQGETVDLLQRLAPQLKTRQPLIRKLVSLLKSRDVFTRMEATRLLGILAEHPDEVIPSLMVGLADHRAIVRARTAEALGRFGKDATGALAKLNEIQKDDYAFVRRQVKEAIKKIDPN